MIEELGALLRVGFYDKAFNKSLLVQLHQEAFNSTPCLKCPGELMAAYQKLKTNYEMAKKTKYQFKAEYKGQSISISGLPDAITELTLNDKTAEILLNHAAYKDWIELKPKKGTPDGENKNG